MINKLDGVMMDTAIIWAKQSYCKRRQVGAILAKDGRVVSNGYNGTASGADNNCEDPGESVKHCTRCGCKDQDKLNMSDSDEVSSNVCNSCNYTGVVKQVDMLVSKPDVIHAEANTILFAAKNGIATESCTLYVTLSPCIECAKMIIQSGIVRVVFLNKYRVTSGIDYLIDNGVSVDQIENSNDDSFLRSNNITVNS